MPLPQCLQLRPDAEQLTEKIFQMRGEGQNESRLFLGRQGRRIDPRPLKPGAQFAVATPQILRKAFVQLAQSIPPVKLFKDHAESEVEGPSTKLMRAPLLLIDLL